MPNNKRYFRIGIFVSAAVLLLTGLLFFFGIAEEFEERIQFATVFSESVQGLSKGSEVKYKGVPIGKVEDITIIAEAKIIRVDMSIDPKVLRSFKYISDEDQRLEKIREFWIKEREAGLCCYLDLAGITGQRYIEMDYMTANDMRSEPLPEINEYGVVYFPSVPSTFNNIIDSVAVALNKISKIDMEKIGDDLDKNLVALNTILTDPSIKNTIKHLENISGELEKVSKTLSDTLTDEDIENLVKSISKNLDSIQALTESLRYKVDQVNIEQLVKQLDKTLVQGQLLMEEMRSGTNNAQSTILQVNSFVDNLNELVDYLKKDPSSLIRGKNAKPVKMNL